MRAIALLMAAALAGAALLLRAPAPEPARAAPKPAAPAAPRQDVEYGVQDFPVIGERLDSAAQDLNADGRLDFINTCVDASKSPPERWLLIHYQRADRTWTKEPDQKLRVPAEAAAMVIGNYDDQPGNDVGLLTADGAYLYAREEGRLAEKPRKAIHTRTFFGTPSQKTLPVWSWGEDIDKNGRSDLVLPTPQGVKVYFQTAPGVFGRMFTLESDLPPDKALQRMLAIEGVASVDPYRPFAVSVRRTQPRVFLADLDSDGYLDLVIFRGETMGYYLYNPKERAFSTGLGGREIVGTLRSEGVGEDLIDMGKAEFADIDCDGNLDLVVVKTKGTLGSLSGIKTYVYIHFGTGYMSFNEQYYFELGGLGSQIFFLDLNGDKCLDLWTFYTPTNILSYVLSLRDVEISSHVYQFLPDKRAYAKDPYTRTAKASLHDYDAKGLSWVPMSYFNPDWTGDGRPDLMDVDTDGAVRVYQGVESQGRIGYSGSAVWTFKLAEHPRGMYFGDYNADGRPDAMLMHRDRLGLLYSKK